jgi:HlyD family secretion protein
VGEGDSVKAGDLLLELWNQDLVAETRLAQREAEAARARAKAACLKAEVAEREARRLLKLKETGATSEERTDKAVTESEALKADCNAAQASALMTEARVAVVRANLARTRLIAPFDGVIAEINGEIHEYLTPSPPGIPTLPAVDLIDHSCFYVSAPIDEVDASEITPGMKARVSLDAFSNRTFDGRVRRIAPYVLDIEKQARTVEVEVGFANAGEIEPLLAGYSADVEIILEVRRDTVRVPTEAVLDGNRVFVFSQAHKIIRERRFTAGISNWDFTEVISGLSEHELVVTNVDQPAIKDGARAVLKTEEL